MYSWGRLILHSPAGPTIMFMMVMILIIIIILVKTCSTQSAPASSWVTPSPEEGASSPSKFVFLSSAFVELFSLYQKKSPLQNFSFLAHPSLYLFPHFSLSWELPLFAWPCYHDTMTFTYTRFKIANSQTCFDNFRLFPAAPPIRHNPCLLFVLS